MELPEIFKPGRIGKDEKNNLYILKKYTGWSWGDYRDSYSFSILFEGGGNAENFRFYIEGPDRNTLVEKVRFGDGSRTKVEWLSEDQVRTLRDERPGIDEYVKLLEEGKPVTWYFGG